MRIDSCGVDAVDGTASPHEAVAVGREFGVRLDEHRSKGLTGCDVEIADLIVPMEYGHYQQLIARFPETKSKIRFIREFAPWPARLLCNTYDPYGLGEDEFRRCFSELRGELDRIKQEVSSN